MKPDLLGYLLHSLDSDDERSVEDYLESHPEARRELGRLRGHLSPLDAWDVGEPPSNLFFNTLRAVASLKTGPVPTPSTNHRPRPSPVSQLQPWQPSEELETGRGSLRRADVWISVALVFVVLMAVPPVLRYVRELAGQVECRDNMRHFYPAFAEFARNNRGYIPVLQKDGNLAHAGVYASYLREAGLWGDEMKLSCSTGGPTIPASIEEVKSHDPNDHAWWTKFGGGYGYNLGYVARDGDKIDVFAVRRADGDCIPILADRPPRPGEVPNWVAANSPSHGGRGQNVMYNGGHVLFQTTRNAVLGDDPDIYSNLQGFQAAGVTPRDAVIGPSEARPLPAGSGYPVD